MTIRTRLTSAAGIALLAGSASAGGLDRSGQSVAAVFGPDNSGSVSVGVVNPSIDGKDLSGSGTYSDVGETYTQTTLSFTNSVNDRLNYALILDQPFGVNLDYTSSPLTTAIGGTGAQLNSTGLNFAARYQINERFSVFGGLGAQRVDASIKLNGTSYASAISTAAITKTFNASLPSAAPKLDSAVLGDAARKAAGGDLSGIGAIDATYGAGTGLTLAGSIPTTSSSFLAAGGYHLNIEQSTRPSFFVGAAYEIPAIALRVAGTYRFETTHKADAVEMLLGTTTPSTIEYKTPASFNLEAQTGIAEGTLLTFNYRWAEWGNVDVIPTALGQDLVNLEDTHRYSLGLARRFSDKFAGSVTVSYEADSGDPVSPLGPTDGLLGLSIGGQYTDGAMKISGGINYTKVGNATAEVASAPVAEFKDNHVIGVGFKVDFTF